MCKFISFTLVIFLKLTVFCISFIYPEKRAVFILGMHRSGTSATTGVLNLLGLDLGTNLVTIGLKDNIKGHFEDWPTIDLNDKILKELSTTWSDPKQLSLALDLKQEENFKYLIKKNFVPRFSDRELFGIKDPRLCLLLPLYLDVIQELGYKPKLIIVLRDPFEIVQSLEVRDKMPKEKAIALTAKYLRSIKDYSENYEKLYIKFDDLLFHTDQVLQRFKKFIPDLDINDKNFEKVKLFLDKDLKHHEVQTTFHDQISVYQELLECYYEQLKFEAL